MSAGGGKRLNLSQPEFKKKTYDGNYRIAIVQSVWNRKVTDALANGAWNELIQNGIKKENISLHKVPGSYELPLAASLLASKFNLDGVICIGCVIKGDTPHFDFISEAVAHGIMEVGLKFQKPVIFGVITTLNMTQAMERAGGKHGNKGVEAAITCLEMLELKKNIQ